jgi:hypothetical protein
MDSHISRLSTKGEKLKTCGLFDKDRNATCMSTQNASFHGSSTHRSHIQKGFHQKTKPSPTSRTVIRNTTCFLTAQVVSDWTKAGRRSRVEEMKSA